MEPSPSPETSWPSVGTEQIIQHSMVNHHCDFICAHCEAERAPDFHSL